MAALRPLAEMQAEFENFRKRTRRTTRAAPKGAPRISSSQLLPVLDNLERRRSRLRTEGGQRVGRGSPNGPQQLLTVLLEA